MTTIQHRSGHRYNKEKWNLTICTHTFYRYFCWRRLQYLGMSQQLRAAALLRQAADLLNVDTSSSGPVSTTISTTGSRASFAPLCSSVPITTTTNTASAVRAIFAPYRRAVNRRGGRAHAEAAAAVSHWTHKFSIIPRCTDETVPSRQEKYRLHHAGLGEKRITFVKSTSKNDFENTLEEAYPKLRDCGGFELLRTPPGSRVALESILMPAGGYTSAYLADESALGQAMCYIRPIQKDLDTEKMRTELSEPCQECLTCGDMIPINVLREHVEVCSCIDDVDTSAEGKAKRRKVSSDKPICGFACKQGNHSADQDIEQKEPGVCPVCGKFIPMELLPAHADLCCQSDEVCKSVEAAHKDAFELPSFEDYLSSKILDEEKVWDISVVRRMLVQQAMVEMEQAPEEEWKRKLSVTFIGEEGLDAGGLTREFLTILYEKSPVFENSVLSFDAQLLYKRHYFFMGQMVVMGILSGHPGPRNLLNHVVDFIVSGKTGELSDIPVDKMERLDAVSAIKEISDCADCNVVEKYGDLLEACGFRQLVTTENRKDAVSAIKNYYLLNRFIPSLLQFMEGLKLHNLLEMFKKYPGQACTFLLKTDHVESLKVKEFFKPVYSQIQAEKEAEEVVIFNFHQFLKKLERGKVLCTRIDVDTDTSTDEVLDMGNLMQALIGCPAFPSSITEGIITFDHNSDQLTTINTCAPSINFSKLSEIKDYSSFEELMKYIIVGSYGFGRE
ncbi:uncharacterized protein LOC128550670 isoform X2 [Mercenaria mercenaria]|uniref:uncharacterized protein LOC128550670 isoform X2 n=1 Tax=Mercenaria mercenaria TaxID=6596 RepID=UPI00234F7E7A|nr:uncharacterized protein LOC128550670 isoform X2 [Mercenaria mercenaria]